MAALAYPARVIGLLLSDVIGDPLHVIGSGLTVSDKLIAEDAEKVLRKYNLWYEVPATVRAHLRLVLPVRSSDRVENIMVGSNRLALEAAAGRATGTRLQKQYCVGSLSGEARDTAVEQAALLRRLHRLLVCCQAARLL